MSDSPESKNTITNPAASAASASTPTTAPATIGSTDAPQVAPAQPSAPASILAPQPTTNATPNPSSAPVQDPSTQFKAENIGSWAAHQEGYFAEQNRKDEEKRQKSEQTRKKILPPLFIAGGIVAAGLVIWGIVALTMALTYQPEPEIDAPTISGGTSEDVNDYREVLQGIFDKGAGENGEDTSSGVAAVEDAVNNALNTDNGKQYADQVKLAEITVLQNNGLYYEAIEKSKGIDIDKLDLSQKISFYSILYYCSSMIGDSQAANEYFKKQYDLSLEQGGEGGGA